MHHYGSLYTECKTTAAFPGVATPSGGPRSHAQFVLGSRPLARGCTARTRETPWPAIGRALFPGCARSANPGAFSARQNAAGPWGRTTLGPGCLCIGGRAACVPDPPGAQRRTLVGVRVWLQAR